jgi:hypothetical protein
VPAALLCGTLAAAKWQRLRFQYLSKHYIETTILDVARQEGAIQIPPDTSFRPETADTAA